MIALTPDNRPFMAGGKVLTFATGSGGPPPEEPAPVDPGSPPTANMAGWWDASTLATLGASAWSAAISTLPDRSTAGKNAGTSATTQPRQAGLLGGLYPRANEFYYTALHPCIADYSIGVTGAAVGASGAFSLCLVWSRATKPQAAGVPNSNAVTLASLGGTPVLGMTSRGDGTDTLILFPNGAATPLGALELRHTHSARLVFNGATLDVWLDGTKVATGAANTLTLGATVNLSLIPNAQLIFHEAAAWSKTLDSTENATLSAYLAAKWPLGRRMAANGILIGQSNADNLIGAFSAWPQLNRWVSYWSGCISSSLLWAPGGTLTAGATKFSGQGLYNGAAWILDSSGGGDPSTWPLGTNGNALMAALDGMDADQKANLRYIAWYWSESDSSLLTYANKATYLAAMKRAISLIRARVSMTAAQLPVLVINALPFTTAAGCQTHREVMADLVADAALNVRFMLAQSDDAIGQGDTWDATTGLESGGGNTAHRDATGAVNFLRRWSAPIARAVIAANAANSTLDAIRTVDASVPVTGGPKIVSAQYEPGTTSVLVTLAHDGGNDLIVPLRAALGVGWTLMDGLNAGAAGNPGTPGALIAATACARVSAIQVRVTLASAPAFPARAQLYYVYGSGLDGSGFAIIGQGNAVTDNFSAVTLAAGWRIGPDLGATAQPNNPLQATTYGIALT